MVDRHELMHHCGVLATAGSDISSSDFNEGWWRIRNRGDDAWGLVSLSNAELISDHVQKRDKDQKPISELKNARTEAKLRLAHNRYATSGSFLGNAQPILLTAEEYSVGVAHNGNLPSENVAHLREMVEAVLPEGASDTRVLTQLLIEARPRYASWEETLIAVLPEFQGAFSLACITDEDVIYAIRDPWGIRPLCLGKKDNTWVVVSESVALESMGADYIREVKPGEMVRLQPDGTSTSIEYAHTDEGEWFCVLELIYFAKVESIIKSKRFKDEHQALGRAVGERFLAKGIPVDYVIPILNSGKQMSVGVSQVLDMSNTEAISIATDQRSFIASTQENREQVVHAKHVVDGLFITGKRILLCDDSLVRGTSLNALLVQIKQHDPAEIHIVLGSEPVIDICDLGVDLPTPEELLAYQVIQDRPDWEDNDASLKWIAEVEQLVAKRLGVNSVTYLDRASVNAALARKENELCRHCMGGTHPIRDHQRPQYLAEKTQVAVAAAD